MFNKRQVLVPYRFHPVLGNNKSDYIVPTKVPVKLCALIDCTAHYTTKCATSCVLHV